MRERERERGRESERGLVVSERNKGVGSTRQKDIEKEEINRK